jgi:CheY-like chemotaxis protein
MSRNTASRVQGAGIPQSPYVLLVDDDGTSLRLLQTIVKLAGHRCVSASSATDAVSSCDCVRPQVVVTDLMMPNLDGHGLALWLRGRFPSVPIILLTGEDLGPVERARFRDTFAAVYTKPLDISSFLKRIDRLMPTSAS